MAYRMLNEKQQAEPNQYQHPFIDGIKMKKDLAYLYEKGIIKGKSAETFSPDDNISREEAAAILDRLFVYLQARCSGKKRYAFTAMTGKLAIGQKTACIR